MKTPDRVALVIVVCLLTAVGCQRQGDSSDVEVKLSVDPDPPKVGPARLTLVVNDKEGKPVEGATLKVEGNMAHAGMKPVFADAKEEKAGRYRADLKFTMGGDWFLLIEGKYADGRSFHKKIPVKGVKSE